MGVTLLCADDAPDISGVFDSRTVLCLTVNGSSIKEVEAVIGCVASSTSGAHEFWLNDRVISAQKTRSEQKAIT